MKKCIPAFLLSMGLLPLMSGTATAELAIDENYQLVRETRLDRTRFQYTFRVNITNTGQAVQNVTAVVTSSSPATVILDGEVIFPDLPAGNTVAAGDTFTLIQNRTIPFDPAVLSWQISSGESSHGGGGCGDIFGDLVKIKRDPVTGQPILEKRWIEYPQDTLAWGYCPIPLDADGNEIPFAENSCDPADPLAVVEIDYFGRLSAGRTKERNSRMHFNEVISKIKMAGWVRQDATGRLELGYDCNAGTDQCGSWSTVDSPVENLALYTRLMKYGHLQTDPLEQDLWAHGDPALGIQYHPALDTQDWAKFAPDTVYLLPRGTAAECFDSGAFVSDCALPSSLTDRDFVGAASLLGGAADKTGHITADLVQYLNRILKITQRTGTTFPTEDTLPALIRDCPTCPPYPADDTFLPPADETFVDFSAASYQRVAWFDNAVTVLVPDAADSSVFRATPGIELLDWLSFINGPAPDPVQNIDAFVKAGEDALRTVEFVHNYAVPEDLGWDFTP